MKLDEVITHLASTGRLIPGTQFDEVPAGPGLYAIFIDEAGVSELPLVFRKYLTEKKARHMVVADVE